MKKTYITPATDAMEIQSTALLAASQYLDANSGSANNAHALDDLEYEEEDF